MNTWAGSRGRLHGATLWALALLLLSLLAWPGLRAGTGGLVLAVLLTMPLLLLAWKLRKPSRRTLQAGILLQGLYLLVGITELIANPAARPGALATSIASLAVCGCLLGLLRGQRATAVR